MDSQGIHAEDSVHVGLDGKRLPNLVAGLSIIGIGRLFLSRQLCVFLLQALYPAESCHPERGKRKVQLEWELSL